MNRSPNVAEARTISVKTLNCHRSSDNAAESDLAAIAPVGAASAAIPPTSLYKNPQRSFPANRPTKLLR